MASKLVHYTIHFSEHACPEVKEILIKADDIHLSQSSTPLTTAVDFVTKDYGIVYITEKEMNGAVKDFLPRILTLIYQYKYLESQKKRKNINNNDTDNNRNKKKKKRKFRFRKKIVYIHYHEENAEKALSLQMFCSDHNVPHVFVQDANHVAKLIKIITKSPVNQRFINVKCNGSYLDNDWGKDDSLLNGSLPHLIQKLPYITEKNNKEVMKHFGSMGALINAEWDQLRVAFTLKQTNFLHKFFR